MEAEAHHSWRGVGRVAILAEKSRTGAVDRTLSFIVLNYQIPEANSEYMKGRGRERKPREMGGRTKTKKERAEAKAHSTPPKKTPSKPKLNETPKLSGANSVDYEDLSGKEKFE